MLTSITSLLSNTVSSFAGDFFNPSSRPPLILQAIGESQITPGFLHQVNRFVQLTAVGCVVIGFFAFVAKRKSTVAERKFFPFVCGGMTLIVSAVVVPNFTAGFNLSRFYHLAILFIAPCIIYGVTFLTSVLNRFWTVIHHRPIRVRKDSLSRLMLISILILYFLFTSGWVWAATMDVPTSLVLDQDRIRNSSDPHVRGIYFTNYITPQEIGAASWLRSYALGGIVCADRNSVYHVLNSYGGLPRTEPILPYGCDLSIQLIYLNAMNDRYRFIATKDDQSWVPISSQLEAIIQSQNRIFSDGGSAVYS